MSDDLIPRLLATNDPLADEAAAEIERLRKALEFYADPESWSVLDFTPVMGHRWDRWCYGGEVAAWALGGDETARLDFEGNRKPSTP